MDLVMPARYQKTWKIYIPSKGRAGVDPNEPINDYGMKLVKCRKIRSANIQRLYNLSVQAPS